MPRPAQKIRQQRYAVALVGDGTTERVYFLGVRDTDRPAGLTIFPDVPAKIGDYRGVLGRASELLANYDRVYALIDMDTVIRDGHLNAYQNAKAGAQEKGVIVLENNPCFEMWFLLHFIHTGRLFNDCGEVQTQLRRQDRIPGYDKSEAFLKQAKLYFHLKEQLQQHAIPNARLLENDREDKGRLYPRAQTFKFFEWYLGQQQ
jgi:RloB-like protein